jgi:hypothetical protein
VGVQCLKTALKSTVATFWLTLWFSNRMKAKICFSFRTTFMSFLYPMLSLVVSTLGRSTEAEALLKSLAQQTYKDFEVVVVDQNGDGRLLPVIDPERWPYAIRRVHVPAIRGVSRGRNIGLKETFPTTIAGIRRGFWRRARTFWSNINAIP